MTKKLFFVLLCIVCLSSKLAAQADINTDYTNKVQQVFAPLDKSRVPYGLLQDYAMEFANLALYNGILTDTNKTDADTYYNLYKTLLTSAVHSNVGIMQTPNYIDSVWYTQRVPGTIALSGLYYNYSRFKEDAVAQGLVTISNGQVGDKYITQLVPCGDLTRQLCSLQVWQNPYETKPVFAIAPPISRYGNKTFT
jgi:hypothetical protein